MAADFDAGIGMLMASTRLVFAATALAALTACTRSPDDGRLRLERHGCMGTCPVYRVEVNGRGEVGFHGQVFVDSSGPGAWKVSPDTAGALLAEFRRLRSEFVTHHPDGPPDCPRGPVAEGGYVISLQTAAEIDTVGRYTECAARGQYPHEAFADRIDEALNTRRRLGRYAAEPVDLTALPSN